jgi:hypothetical protein
MIIGMAEFLIRRSVKFLPCFGHELWSIMVSAGLHEVMLEVLWSSIGVQGLSSECAN